MTVLVQLVAGLFGTTNIGESSATVIEERERVCRATLGELFHAAGVGVYLEKNGSVTGAQKLRVLIYADAAGKPGALVAQGETEVTDTQLTGGGWLRIPFAKTIELAPGTYWIGHQTGGPNRSLLRIRYTNGAAGVRAQEARAYSLGASTPWTTTTATDNNEQSTYVYAEAGSTPVSEEHTDSGSGVAHAGGTHVESWSKVTTETGTAGLATQGAKNGTWVSGFKSVNKVTVPAGSFITKLTVYLGELLAAEQALKPVVYADDGEGKPGAKLGEGPEVKILAKPLPHGNGWYDLYFSTPVAASGAVWIGTWAGTRSQAVHYFWEEGATGVLRYVSPQEYSTSGLATDPFSGGIELQSDTRVLSIYASFYREIPEEIHPTIYVDSGAGGAHVTGTGVESYTPSGFGLATYNNWTAANYPPAGIRFGLPGAFANRRADDSRVTVRANSAAMVKRFLEETPAVTQLHPAKHEGFPFVFAASSDALRKVKTSAGYADWFNGKEVRIPTGAPVQANSDGHLAVVLCPSDCERLNLPLGTTMDCWQAQHSAATIGFSESGTVLNTSTAERGHLDGTLIGGGSTASNMDMIAGLVRAPEMLALDIKHALALVVANSRKESWVYPASKSDGTSEDPNAPPAGQRFRLKLTDAQIEALPIKPYQKAIAKALAHYGCYLQDTGNPTMSVRLDADTTYTRLGGTHDLWKEAGEREGLILDSTGGLRWEMLPEALNLAVNLQAVSPPPLPGTEEEPPAEPSTYVDHREGGGHTSESTSYDEWQIGGGEPVTGEVPGVPTGPAVPTGGWVCVFGDAFQLPLGPKGKGKNHRWYPNSNTSLPSNTYVKPHNVNPSEPANIELGNFIDSQQKIGGEGLELDVTADPTGHVGSDGIKRFYDAAEVSTDRNGNEPVGYELFQWKPGQGATIVFELIARLPVNTGEMNPAFWSLDGGFDDPKAAGWHSELDLADWWGWNSEGSAIYKAGIPVWIYDTTTGASVRQEIGYSGDPILGFDPSETCHRYTWRINSNNSIDVWIDGLYRWHVAAPPSLVARWMGIKLTSSIRAYNQWFTAGTRRLLVKSFAVYCDPTHVNSNVFQRIGLAPGTGIATTGGTTYIDTNIHKISTALSIGVDNYNGKGGLFYIDSDSGTAHSNGSTASDTWSHKTGTATEYLDAKLGGGHSSGTSKETHEERVEKEEEHPLPEEEPVGIPTGSIPLLRAIDPGECWVQHVIRGQAGEGTTVARATFIRADDGINGERGWQHAETTLQLSDDGTFLLALPNVAGDDGTLHRERFNAITDPNYEPGEEWLEFYRDPHDLMLVGTPTDYEITPSLVVIKGSDLTAVYAGVYSSDVDAWDAAAPADVFTHYSRIPVLAAGEDRNTQLVGQPVAEGQPGSWSETIGVSFKVAADCWTVEAKLRWTGPRPSAESRGQVQLQVGGLVTVRVDLYEGFTWLFGPAEQAEYGKRQGLPAPGVVDLRIVARYDRIFAFVAGELVAEYRRPTWATAPEWAVVEAFGGTAVLDGFHVETLAPFATAVVDQRLPGLPPATGLRAQYWSVADVFAKLSTQQARLQRLWPLEKEPNVDRVEPALEHAGENAPNMPGAFAARWSGAIYLDLATSDRELAVSGLAQGSVGANARVYVGHTLRGQEAASSWTSTPVERLNVSSLRKATGSERAGWYPIVVELVNSTAALAITLSDRRVTGVSGVVPESRLSPIGVYSDVVRYTPHREIIGNVAQAFGYQWRVEPRQLESSQFPGVIAFADLVGRLTDLVIDDETVGTEAQVQGAAGDVVDGLVADAAGIADPQGSGQVSAQVVDYARARQHLALRQGYESLADISEAPMLRTRIDSLLALRGSPNEQVGVRPKGQRDIADSFPLTGRFARMDWLPGDGVRLRLDSIGVRDESPRQLTQVTWPLRPAGLGNPTVAFRQRPRNLKAAVRKLGATIFGPRRTYQGGIAILTGTVGGSGGTDTYSRAPLPANPDSIVKVIAVVQDLQGTGWQLIITDTAPAIAIPSRGRYDVTGLARPQIAGAPYIYAKMGGGTGVSPYYVLTLEVWVAV